MFVGSYSHVHVRREALDFLVPASAGDPKPVEADKVKIDNGSYGSMTLHSFNIDLEVTENGLRYKVDAGTTVASLAALLKTLYQ